jgi:hypothetical protein
LARRNVLLAGMGKSTVGIHKAFAEEPAWHDELIGNVNVTVNACDGMNTAVGGRRYRQSRHGLVANSASSNSVRIAPALFGKPIDDVDKVAALKWGEIDLATATTCSRATGVDGDDGVASRNECFYMVVCVAVVVVCRQSAITCYTVIDGSRCNFLPYMHARRLKVSATSKPPSLNMSLPSHDVFHKRL